MKRNNNNHNIHASSVNDMPDIEIVDLENDTMQDTDSGNFHSGNTRSGSVHNFHTDSDDDIEDLYVDADEEIPEGEESVCSRASYCCRRGRIPRHTLGTEDQPVRHLQGRAGFLRRQLGFHPSPDRRKRSDDH